MESRFWVKIISTDQWNYRTISTEEGHHEDRNGNDPEQDRVAAQNQLAHRAAQQGNFTIRGILLGLVFGVVIIFSNTYFGLQTGWISGMSMPSALMGFAVFKALKNHIKVPFSPVENVLIQTVASSMGTMPLGCGFVGVVPALEYLLQPSENGPLHLSTGKLMLWAVGICLFGVVFAVPLRREVIIREKLKFPTGTATALMIGVLHGEKGQAKIVTQDGESRASTDDDYENRQLLQRPSDDGSMQDDESVEDDGRNDNSGDWKDKIRLLSIAFALSVFYTLFSYFVPQIRNVPFLGLPLANNWLWTLNPSPAYVGQGIIMGPATTTHMLLGAILGWGILSPLAKHYKWAPGPVSDWNTGSKGWIVWVSLAIMLADSIVSLGWLITRPLINFLRRNGRDLLGDLRQGQWKSFARRLNPSPISAGYSALTSSNLQSNNEDSSDPTDSPEIDAPPEHLVSPRSLIFWLVASISIYFASVHLAFPNIIPFSASFVALLLSTLLSIMGVRALGETDLNPVSGISKLTQLFFAFFIPSSNPNAVTINLLAGAVSESGAMQAGDLLQDLKTGHLLGAAPNAQFYGQIIGSIVGAVVSAAVYKLYTDVYTVPSGQFQIPTAYVWVFTARLVTGTGLPNMVAPFAVAFGGLFAVLTALRTYALGKSWQAYIPGGIAVAVGMYNVPSFTVARALGGALTWYWTKWRGGDETSVVVLASGLILGEGLFSIANLVMASFGVPHL